PLTPALLTISLLERDKDVPPKFRPDIDVIRRNIETEARLIDDLLDLTRVMNRKMSLTLELVDVHRVIHSAARACRPDDGIDFVLELTARNHTVRADPARLQQVFWNLMSNAHKFTPIGGSLTIRSENPTEGAIAVEFQDTGRGIDPALLPNIFNAFEQGDPQT